MSVDLTIIYLFFIIAVAIITEANVILHVKNTQKKKPAAGGNRTAGKKKETLIQCKYITCGKEMQ
jgi:hypothetical protein